MSAAMKRFLLLVAAFIPALALAQLQPINTGGYPNAPGADTLYDAANKINGNESQLATMFGASGLVRGNGSFPAPLTSASLSDITGLFTGSCSSSNIVFGDGHCGSATVNTDISQATSVAMNTITARTQSARQAYHYNILDFGAKGDVTSAPACAMTAGAATLVCVSGTFAATDCNVSHGGGCTGTVDKAIDVTGAGTTQCAPPYNCTLHSTIIGFTSSSTVTLAANAVNTVPFYALVYITGTSTTTAYVPGDVLTVTGGTLGSGGVASTSTLISTMVSTIAVNAGGSGGAYDSKSYCRITGTTGTGYRWVGSGTLTAGALTAVSLTSSNGYYTTNPTLTGDGVSGCGLSGATVNLTMIPDELHITTPGKYFTAAPPGTASTSGGTGTGLTLSASWVQMGQATFYTDSTAAFTAAITQVNLDFTTSAARTCIYLPPGGNYGITAALPIFAGPGCVYGDASSWKTNLYVAPSVNGDIFSWSNTNQSTDASRITGGNTINFKAMHQGAVVYGLTVQGDRATTNHIVILHPYDVNDYMVVDELNAQMIRGQFIKTGDTLNSSGAYVRESFFGHVRCDDCGDVGKPVWEWSASGSNTGGAPTEILDWNAYGNFGECISIHDEASGDLRGLTFYRSRCESNQNNTPGVQADQLHIGTTSPTLSGKVDRITFYDSTFTNNYYGYCAIKIEGGSQINYGIWIKGVIEGGNPQGQGICYYNGKASYIDITNINTAGPNLVVGPTSGGVQSLGLGDSFGLSANTAGDLHYWTTSIDGSATALIGTPLAYNGFDSNYPYKLPNGLWKVDFSGNVTSASQISGSFTATGTGADQLQGGTFAQRPGSPVAGTIRYDSTLGMEEIYSGVSAAWRPFSGSFVVPACQFSSVSPVTHTGDTTETTVKTCTLLANVIPPVSMVRITVLWSRSATTTNTVTYNIRWGTSSGAANGQNFMTATNAVSSVGIISTVSTIYNVASASQLAIPAGGNTAPTGTATTALNTATVNTANQTYFNFDCTDTTSSADTCGIYAYTVEVLQP